MTLNALLPHASEHICRNTGSTGRAMILTSLSKAEKELFALMKEDAQRPGHRLAAFKCLDLLYALKIQSFGTFLFLSHSLSHTLFLHSNIPILLSHTHVFFFYCCSCSSTLDGHDQDETGGLKEAVEMCAAYAMEEEDEDEQAERDLGKQVCMPHLSFYISLSPHSILSPLSLLSLLSLRLPLSSR